MEPMLILIGFFILAAILNNKELSANDASDKNEGTFMYIAISAIFLILCGVGFLFPNSRHITPNFSFMIPGYIFLAAVPIFAKGPMKVMANVGVIAIFSYLMILSY